MVLRIEELQGGLGDRELDVVLMGFMRYREAQELQVVAKMDMMIQARDGLQA